MSRYLDDSGVDPQFAAALVYLAEATNAKLTEGRIRSYAEDLGDVEFARLAPAFAQARRVCKFFPTIPEIRQFLAPAVEEAALLAWAALNTAAERVGAWATVEIADGAAASATELVFGSWPAFCQQEDGPALAQKRQEWLAAYRVAARRGDPARRLAGLCGEETGAVLLLYEPAHTRALGPASDLTTEGR